MRLIRLLHIFTVSEHLEEARKVWRTDQHQEAMNDRMSAVDGP